MKINLTIIFFICATYLFAQKTKIDKKGTLISMENLDLFSMVQPVPDKNIFSDSTYAIWCGSVTKAQNGKFYMFYSRWKREFGHEAWITHSE